MGATTSASAASAAVVTRLSAWGALMRGLQLCSGRVGGNTPLGSGCGDYAQSSAREASAFEKDHNDPITPTPRSDAEYSCRNPVWSSAPVRLARAHERFGVHRRGRQPG